MSIIKQISRGINGIGEVGRVCTLKLQYGKNFHGDFSIKINKFSRISLDPESHLEVGKNFVARDGLQVRIEHGSVTIGDRVFMNNYCSINCLNSIAIGDDCIFGENVKIYDHNHSYSENRAIYLQPMRTGNISIGKNCWIGSNTVILKGVHIGNHCVIGANSVIYKDVPAETLHLSNGEERRIMVSQ